MITIFRSLGSRETSQGPQPTNRFNVTADREQHSRDRVRLFDAKDRAIERFWLRFSSVSQPAVKCALLSPAERHERRDGGHPFVRFRRLSRKTCEETGLSVPPISKRDVCFHILCDSMIIRWCIREPLFSRLVLSQERKRVRRHWSSCHH